MLKHYNFIIEKKVIDVYAASRAEAYEKAKQIIDEIKHEKDSD